MNTSKHPTWSRREFLHGLILAGGAGLLGLRSGTAVAESPPETTTIRLVFDPEIPVLCYAPQYVAEHFLRIEGFTEIRYVPFTRDDSGHNEGSDTKVLVSGAADIAAALHVDLIAAIDKNQPITVIGGLHAGCFELFASKEVRTISELKGRRVAVTALGSPEHNFIAGIAAYIGLDPSQDIEWVNADPNDWAAMLAEGKVDAIGTFPPLGYDLHANDVGHVILYTTVDEPWRHYFCCMVGARRDFVQNYPSATKRALRAILKANQLCSLEPERTARWLVDRGYEANYAYALQTLQDVQYSAWRDYDPDDTLRFYSLRLRDAGFIKSTPQQIIAQGTDWRFFNELKKELKA